MLVVDTDPQGNLGRDLGYGSRDGSSLGLAITHGLPLEVTRGVRDRLDVVAGGPALWDVAPAFTSRGARGATLPGSATGPGPGRAPRVPTQDYDVVLVDTPPGEPILQELVFAAADYLIIPTRSDEASLDGLVVVAQRFAAARAVNPDLTLLGVVAVRRRAGSTRMIARVRAALHETLGGAAPVFRPRSGTWRAPRSTCAVAGAPARTSADAPSETKQAPINRLRKGAPADTGDSLLSRDSSAAGLAADYAALADEVLTAMKARKGGAKRRLEVAV